MSDINLHRINIDQALPLQGNSISSSNGIIAGRIVSYGGSDDSAIKSEKKRTILYIALAALALVAGIALAALAFTPIGLALEASVAMLVCGMLTFSGGGLGGMIAYSNFKSARSAERDFNENTNTAAVIDNKKIKELLKAKKFEQIPVKKFVNFINEQNTEKDKTTHIDYQTNASTLADVDTLMLGDYHGDPRVHNCNTLAAKYFCREKDVIYGESTRTELIDTMIGRQDLASNLKLRVWDINYSNGDWIGTCLAVGKLLETIIGLGPSKTNDKSTIEQTSKQFKAICTKFPDCNPDKTNQKTSLKSLKDLAKKVDDSVSLIFEEIRKSIDKTFEARQKNLVKILSSDESEMSSTKHKTTVLAGARHFIDFGKVDSSNGTYEADKFVKDYLISSRRKFLILSASNDPDRPHKARPKSFNSLGNLITLSCLLDLLEVKRAEARELFKY